MPLKNPITTPETRTMDSIGLVIFSFPVTGINRRIAANNKMIPTIGL